MANGTLNFSVIFNAVTQAFNAGVKGAAQNYQQATRDMNTAGTQLGQNTAALADKLQNVFKATSAKDIVSAFRAATQELNNTKQGATLTAAELAAIGRAGKTAATELNAALRTAQAELKALQQSKAAPADLTLAKTKVAELRTELAQSSAEYSRLQAAATAAMRRAAAETQNVDNASKQAGSSIYNMLNIKSGGQLRAEIAAINQQLAAFKANASVPPAELSRVTQAAQQNIAKLRAEVGGTTPLFGQMAGAIKSIGPAAAVLTGVTVGLASVKEGVEAVIAATIRYEATMKQLEFALGSVALARQEYEFLLDVTKRLGLDLNASAEGFAKLAAATKGTALEGQQTRVIFEGVASAAASLNLSAADTSGVMLALSQIITKGKVSMEELRGQLGERLPGAMQIAARSMGLTTAELEKMVESGVDSIQFMEKFGPAMVAAFGPTAAQNVNSLSGQINLLKTEFELLLVKIGKGGIGQAAVAVFQDLRGAIEGVSGAIDDMDPTTVAAVKEVFKQLYDLVGETFFALLNGVGEAASALNGLINGVLGVVAGFVGLEQSNEQVGLLTRSIQVITILLGALNDNVKAVEIAFTLATGVVQSFFSAVVFGLSKITFAFGDLSRQLEQFAFDMQDKAQASFEKASQKALEFRSSAVAAADAAIAAHTKAGEEVKKAHSEASDAAQTAQGQIGTASKDAANAVAAAHTGAAGQVVAAQGQMATAAQQTKEVIKLSAVEGEKAIVGMAAANQAVIKALQDLAKESGIALPATKLSANQVAEVMGEVAAKSNKAAEAIGTNLKEAIDNLKAKDFVVLWDGYTKGLEKAGASTELLNKTTVEFATQASKLLGGDLTAALGKFSEGFGDNIKVLGKLIASMDNLKKQGVDTGVALAGALDGMLSKAKNPTEITQLIKYWEDLGKQGLVTGQQMNEGLEKARQKLDEVKPGVNSINEALRTLGQTANDTATNMQAKYTEAFRVLRESGQATFTQLTQGLKTMFDAANDTKSLEKLKQLFQDLGNQGKIASYDVKQGLVDIQNKMDEMKPGINSLAEAFKTFGLTTREEAAAMADKYGQAFQVMRDSGQATTAELRQAFTRYAEAAVQANGGVVDGFVQAQAAAQGLQVRVDETGKVIVEAMGAGTNATNALSTSLDRAIDQYGKLGSAAQAAAEAALAAQEKELEMQERLLDAKQKAIDLENRRRNVDRDGFSTDPSGNRITAEVPTWLSIVNQLKGYGVDETNARKLANDFTDSQGNVPYFNNPGQKKYGNADTLSLAVLRAAEAFLRAQDAPKLNTGGTGSPNTGSGSGSGTNRTTNVNISNGSQRVGVSVAPGDEQRFLNMLGTSRGVS
jgi:tape measure domain-containing protein